MKNAESDPILTLTSDIVAAYVSNNSIAASEVPGLIKTIREALRNVTNPEPLPALADKPVPAVPIKKSVHPDYIVCLEDGKKLKMLKRHLATRYNMTPEQYRAKWGLPENYPLVAPNYAKVRSAMAKEIGLGRSAKAD